MSAKYYQLKCENKDHFIIVLKSVLDSIGAQFPDEGLKDRGTIAVDYFESEAIEGESRLVFKKLVIDFLHSQPKKIKVLKSDTEGRVLEYEYIVKTLDDQGNPLEYELYPGYHIELASNVPLSFPLDVIVAPEVTQYKWT